MISRIWLTLALASGLAAGCAQSTVTLEYAAESVGQAACDYGERCDLLRDLSIAQHGESCVDGVVGYLANEWHVRYDELIARGDVRVSEAALDRCVAAHASAVCGPHPVFGPFDGCDDVFVGTLPDGTDCSESAECGGRACLPTSPGRCGTCRHLGGLLAPCAEVPCASGLFCDASAHCAAYVPRGATCDPTGATVCTPFTLCDPTSHTCIPFPAVSDGEDCIGVCASGSICATDGGVLRCRPPRSDGTCTTILGPGTDCPGATCVLDSCMPYPTLGQSCSGPCESPARCVLGTCVVSRANGEACATDADCWSERCAAGTCASRPLCN